MVKNIKTKKSTSITISRPPIVVVLGHVDHGKTTLLDNIRTTSVTTGESGGITQKIGAYQINIDESIVTNSAKTDSKGILPHDSRRGQDDFTDNKSRKITFIDTPGHEAFVKMRSRGAKVADIALLVVAANDGVMPQTRESIKFIKEAKIPMIVVINKSDLEEADPNKVMQQLAKEDVLVEKLGGKVLTAQVSAKTGKGVKELLDLILLLWEMMEVKADANGLLRGIVIEAKMDKKRGILATVIVKNGTLKIGDTIYAEEDKAKIKAMLNHKFENQDKALPGSPVEIMGWEKLPKVGSEISTTQFIKNVVSSEETSNYELSLPPLEQSNKLKIILKTDNFGSLEAISEKLPENIDLVAKGIGEITEADVLHAKSTQAIIIGFNLKPNSQVLKLSQLEKVKIKTYSIIYELLDEISEVINLLNQPEAQEDVLGEALISAEFKFDASRVAGCKVVSGRIARGDKVKIIRLDGEIGRGRIKTLRHGKSDMDKSEINTECGIVFDKKLDFKTGDRIISYRMHELLT